jgi:hypothetical protein
MDFPSNRFKDVDLTDHPNLNRILQTIEIKRRSHKDLIMLFFDYQHNRKYKQDGFPTFKKATEFLSPFSEESMNIDTLQHYYSIYNSYVDAGFSIDVLADQSIQRLKQLKPFVNIMSIGEALNILSMNSRGFKEKIGQMSEGKTHTRRSA